jgi:hypothetical protein
VTDVAHRPRATGPRRTGAFLPLGLTGLLLILSLVACSEGQTDLVNPGTNRDGLGALPDTVSGIAVTADRSYRPRLASGSSSSLVLVREGTVTSTVYLRFDLTGIADTLLVTGGQLGLRFQGGDGGPVVVEALRVAPSAPDWNEDDVQSLDLPLEEPPFFTTSGISPPADTTVLVPDVIDFGPALLRDWIAHPETNRGMALRIQAGSAEGSLEIASKEAVIDTTGGAANPPLEVFRAGLVSVILAPTDDAYVLMDSSPAEAGTDSTFLLEERVPYRGLVGFDPTGFRPGDTINRADLQLAVVPGSVAEGDTFVVALYPALSAWVEDAEPDSVARGATALGSFTVTSATETAVLELGALFQTWVDGADNFGAILRITNEGGGASQVRFFSREASSARTPRLDVVFTPAPGTRWDGPGGRGGSGR